jgi:hypothetical protein
MKLNASSSAGLSVIDFDKNKNYRLIIPCTNSTVYSFDIEGKSLKDWHFEKSDAPITQAIQSFKIRKDDYLVCSDKYSTYILNKKGEKKITANQKFDLSKNARFYLDRVDEDKAQAFLITDKNGQIKRIDFEGKVQTISVDDYSNDHYFLCTDLNNDGINDFVIVDKKHMQAYSNSGKKLFSYEFDEKIVNPPSAFTVNETKKVLAILSATDNKAYLFTSNGTLISGFPLQGKTMFSVGSFSTKSKTYSLLIGNSENFLYNYELK